MSSLSKEYSVPEGTMRSWIKKYREECENNPTMQSEADQAAEIKRLKKELAEAKKENDFLKKRQHSLRRNSISKVRVHKEI